MSVGRFNRTSLFDMCASPLWGHNFSPVSVFTLMDQAETLGTGRKGNASIRSRSISIRTVYSTVKETGSSLGTHRLGSQLPSPPIQGSSLHMLYLSFHYNFRACLDYN
ncbi:hypothetical protein PILCRDRAFT_747679 [Piloderma croceum F 1598]|uniref:Uncharacterized protein n=1 Tax=Piloderma croceum (strain F 1598) TaxID=765440 RepID=A0A0C3EV69_PILCF|nr:hypothetical protein PILCRDRAFT_747679 [Piloderma croceum F 1598]